MKTTRRIYFTAACALLLITPCARSASTCQAGSPLLPASKRL